MPIATEVSIYIKRDDLIMGPFSESQTVKRYHRGEFRDTDLAMIDGMTGWHPLATYIVDEGDDAPSIFDASAPPPIPQNEPPPRFDMGDEPPHEAYDETREGPREERMLDERRGRFEFANPVSAAWALLGLGVVVMVLSRWPVLLWIPLILAAIGLAVQQLVRRNYVHAGPLLAVALLAPWFVWSQWLSPARPHAVKATTEVIPVAATPALVIPKPAPALEPPKIVVAKPEATPAPPAPEPNPEPPELVSAPPKFAKGEFVVLLADTKLRFEGKELRLGKAGERFEVLAASPDKIYLKTKTARGQVIAITAPPEQLKSAPPPAATPVRLRTSSSSMRPPSPWRAGCSLLQCFLGFFIAAAAHAETPAAKPNIVFILADDLGYGDVQCLNPAGKIKTPHIDAVAAAGMKFTDAHTSSAVCTPTRYGLLTGRYNWRSRLQSGVLGGMSPPLIEPGRLTVASLLRRAGYQTACIGKWHLGIDWPLLPGAPKFGDGIESGLELGVVDFAQVFRGGPMDVGFGYFFGISASLDMVPYTFIVNSHVKVLPTVPKSFPMMAGRPGGQTRKGLAAEGFEAVDVLPTLTREAVDHITNGASTKGQPFFLYLPLTAPHTPIAPTPEWQGKSGLNPYADFVMEVDATVGAIVAALEKSGLTKNTLLFVTSDNGCSPEAKIPELQALGHYPSGPLRGYKADIFDGGHRVPFIARWPGQIPAGSTSDEVVCLNDFMATCAQLTGTKLPENAGEDSVSLLPLLRGEKVSPVHEALVHHSINGSFAIRQGKWKLELCAGSGGWSAPRPGSPAEKGLPPDQLYDLSADLGEQRNVAAEHPDVVERLTKLLESYVANGRSTPGAPQANTGEVKIRKGPQKPVAAD